MAPKSKSLKSNKEYAKLVSKPERIRNKIHGIRYHTFEIIDGRRKHVTVFRSYQQIEALARQATSRTFSNECLTVLTVSEVILALASIRTACPRNTMPVATNDASIKTTDASNEVANARHPHMDAPHPADKLGHPPTVDAHANEGAALDAVGTGTHKSSDGGTGQA